MASVINTNIASINTQRSLSASQANLNTSIQRLSSGLRINSAKDDAAGLSIASRMDSQIRGNNVAVKNVNDAISLAQTAEGALSSVTDSLQRIRELSVQSANATNTNVDRASLNSEVTQLKQEIERVANTTSFNGTKLLDGSFTGQTFQVGASAGETLSIDSITDVNLAALGIGQFTQASVSNLATNLYPGPIFTGDLVINGHTIPSDFPIYPGSASGRANEWVTVINGETGTTGVTANFDGTNLTLTSNSTFTITTLLGAPPVVPGTYTTGQSIGITNLDISTDTGATNAITSVDSALTQVNSARAKLGAIQNRFSSVVANLQTANENVSAAKSRIMDADFAAETANLTRGQILQQAGTAMLAQANSLPNNVLSLLRG